MNNIHHFCYHNRSHNITLFLELYAYYATLSALLNTLYTASSLPVLPPWYNDIEETKTLEQLMSETYKIIYLSKGIENRC